MLHQPGRRRSVPRDGASAKLAGPLGTNACKSPVPFRHGDSTEYPFAAARAATSRVEGLGRPNGSPWPSGRVHGAAGRPGRASREMSSGGAPTTPSDGAPTTPSDGAPTTSSAYRPLVTNARIARRIGSDKPGQASRTRAKSGSFPEMRAKVWAKVSGAVGLTSWLVAASGVAVRGSNPLSSTQVKK
jgi:hypothetical protein